MYEDKVGTLWHQELSDNLYMKTCTDCHIEKPFSEYSFPKSNGGRPASKCKPCAVKYAVAWAKKNRERAYATRRRWYQNHKEEAKAQVREWCAKNRERVKENKKRYHAEHPNKERMRAWSLRVNFNITIEAYEAMYRAQNGVCKICQEPCLSGKRLAVDHSHTTGTIRGLLCSKCNLGVGSFRDNPELLVAASEYLKAMKEPA